MSKNTFHEVLDLISKKKMLADKSYKEYPEDCKWAMDFIKALKNEAVCFSISHECASGMKVIPELIKLPYETCWFESVDKDTGVTNGYLAHEKNKCIYFLLFQKDLKHEYMLVATTTITDGNILKQYIGFESDIVKRAGSWLCQALSALNCCNIKRTEHKPEPSKQSVRRALGRQPLFSTWTLEIDLQRTESEMPGQGGTHASPRLHLRRGHARQHKPGLWCWVQPHVVGDKSLGMIHKDYASQ